MPQLETQSACDQPGFEVLALPEVAAYLRVPEKEVLELVEAGGLPGQKIGKEWRFLKWAVNDWLRFGLNFRREFAMIPPSWMLDHPFWEELFQLLEQRILSKLPGPEGPSAKRGSKQAVLKHFGVFKEDDDLEEQLAAIRAIRVAAGK